MAYKTPFFWKNLNPISMLLWPLSLLYRFVAFLHGKSRAKRGVQVNATVISVGNITAGGAGKTPVVKALARAYTEKGERVAILTRGYGAASDDHQIQVTKDHTPEQVGDEAVELFRAQVAEQVWAGKNRIESAKSAVNRGATMLIIDDGFQYRALQRDINILVIDGNYGLGNEMCLPAGPLREGTKQIHRADFSLVVNPPEDHKVELDIPQLPVRIIMDKRKLGSMKQRPIVAFCGIGIPDKFFRALEEAGLNIKATKKYADHYAYKISDIEELKNLASQHDALLMTTAKDAVKLPESLDLAVVEIDMSKTDLNPVVEKIDQILASYQESETKTTTEENSKDKDPKASSNDAA